MGKRLFIEVEVPRRALLEPEPLLLGRVAQKVGCLLENILDRHVLIRLWVTVQIPNARRPAALGVLTDSLCRAVSGHLPFERVINGALSGRLASKRSSGDRPGRRGDIGAGFVVKYGSHIQLGGLLSDIREILGTVWLGLLRWVAFLGSIILGGEIFVGDAVVVCAGWLAVANGPEGLVLLVGDQPRIGAP